MNRQWGVRVYSYTNPKVVITIWIGTKKEATKCYWHLNEYNDARLLIVNRQDANILRYYRGLSK